MTDQEVAEVRTQIRAMIAALNEVERITGWGPGDYFLAAEDGDELAKTLVNNLEEIAEGIDALDRLMNEVEMGDYDS